MDFYSFSTTAKYTKGLLDTFNDIKIMRNHSAGVKYFNVPINFSSKNAAAVYSEKDKEQILQGNNNILPRMSLALTNIERDQSRDTSRFNTITVNSSVDNKTFSFQLNPVSYIFNYSLTVAAKGLIDLTTIVEQILPFFNPSLNLSIRELDWLSEPTTIKTEMAVIDIDLPEENLGDDIRIVSATINLKLHGNIYPPIKEGYIINNVKLYLSPYIDESEIPAERRFIKNDYNVLNGFIDPSSTIRIDFDNLVDKQVPNIVSVDGPTTILPETQYSYKIIVDDNDDEARFTYIVNIVENTTGENVIIHKSENIFLLQAGEVGSIKLSIQVIDRQGNQSNLWYLTLNSVLVLP